MPAPSNISFATAIDIGTTLPYSLTGIDPTDGAGTGYYTYYKIVIPANLVGAMIGCLAYRASGTTVLPIIKLYTAPGVPYLGAISLANKRLQFPGPAEGTTIYFEIQLTDLVAASFTFDFSVYSFTAQTVPDASFLVNSDVNGYPAAILDPTTGEILSFQNQIIAGEGGDMLPDGTFLLSPQGGSVCKIYNPDLSLKANVTITGIYIAGSGNQVDTFYVLTIEGGSFYIRTVDIDGNVGSPFGPLSSNLSAAGANLAVSRDETVAYITNGKGTGTDRGVIYRWDLVNNIALSNLANLVVSPGNPPPAPLSAGTYFLSQVNSGVSPGSIIVLANGNIVVLYWRSNEADSFIRVYTPLGVVVTNITFPTSQNFNVDRLCHDPADDNTFWVWLKEGGLAATFGFGKFVHYNGATGAFIAETLVRPEVQNGGANRTAVTATTDEFGFPFSCPVLILRQALSPETGSITVIKETSPDDDPQEFNFTAGDGLTPTSFTLTDNGTQSFTDLEPGDGYSVVEAPVTGWATTYEVSNGSPIDNISVGAGEAVTVTVRNAKITGGIYKIVPESEKTNDTLWTEGFDSTVNVKIPDPTVRFFGV